MKCIVSLAVASVVFFLVGSAHANPIVSVGGASVTIDNSGGGSGAIGAFTFGGVDFFNPGSPVSDFGFQVGANTGTFGIVTTTDFTSGVISGVTVATDGTTVTVNGTYNSNVAFTRTYAFVSGLDVLAITTSVTNNSGGALAVRVFDTFDPDQGTNKGNGPGTTNDVFPLAGTNVAQAIETGGYTAIIGSLDPLAIVGFHNSLGIASGSQLNSFFGGPLDPNGAFQDIGFSIAREFNLGAGQSESTTFLVAVGTTAQNAQNQFSDAAAPIPEPTSLAVFGMMAAGGAFYGWRRRSSVTNAQV